ncbi:Guanylate cyclase (Partial), partial [Seminavis robusta]|eukprot:Sro4481_g354090.1 Guanylate cyclase (125) ;mRNA; r:2-376
MTMEATIPKHHPEPTAEAHEDDDASFEMTSRSVDDKFSIPGHISVSSGMTGVESLEPEDEVRNVENLTKGDTRLIQFWRFVVVACMALAGVAVSVGAYTYISELEKQDGQNAFILFSNTITDISK